MSRARKRRPWESIVFASLVLASTGLSACRRRRHAVVSEEIRRRLQEAAAEEWDRQEVDDAPKGRTPPPPLSPPIEPPSPPFVITGRAPAPRATPAPSPMDEARACFRSHPNDMAAGDACAVQVLGGRATTESEIGLLAVTCRTMGRRADAVRAMREYIARYPDGPRVPSFSQYIAHP